MHAAIKILIGLLIIVIGFGLFVDSPTIGMWNSITGINWWNNFVIVVTGVIPALLILLGLFIVWLEADEIKAEKAIESETDTAADVKQAVSEKKAEPKRAAARKKK